MKFLGIAIVTLITALSTTDLVAENISDKLDVDSHYVGAKVCANCHKTQTQAWQGSHHAKAMQHASEETVLGDFDNTLFKYNGITTKFYNKDNNFFVQTDGAEGELGDYRIKYTFGVHPLQQYLIEFPDGRLQALGIAWDNRKQEQGGQRWYHLYPEGKVTHKDRLHWTGADQNWNYMCSECHSTNLEKNYDLKSNTYNTRWSEINVSCEACHGPASMHIIWANKESGWNLISQQTKGLTVVLDDRKGVSWRLDDKTGNAKRSKEKTTNKEIETCARCHSHRSVISSNYKPGDKLMDHYQPAVLTDSLYHSDGQIKEEVYVYGSFIQSKMYHEGVTCSDCHAPHSLSLRAPGNKVCLQCHQQNKYEHKSHHFHSSASKGAECAECHMPQTTYMGVDGRHDHSIRIPRPDLSLKHGTPNACNNCHTDKKANWANKQMEAWYGKDWSPGWHFGETFSEQRSGKAGLAQELAAVSASPKIPVIVRATAASYLDFDSNPLVGALVGHLLKDKEPMVRYSALKTLKSFPLPGRLKLASPLLTDAVKAVRIEAARVLAVLPPERLSSQQQSLLEKGLEEYRQAQYVNAERPESHINLGLLEVSLQNFEAAESAYQQAKKLDPGFGSSYVNLADLYRILGQDKKVKAILEQGLELSYEDPAIHHSFGLMLVRNKKLNKALSELKIAHEMDRGNARYGYVFAVALNSSGVKSEAIDVLVKVNDQHPADRDTLLALISFSRANGNRAMAEHYAGKLVEIDSRYGNATQVIENLK